MKTQDQDSENYSGHQKTIFNGVNLTFEEYRKHLQFMEKHDTTNTTRSYFQNYHQPYLLTMTLPMSIRYLTYMPILINIINKNISSKLYPSKWDSSQTLLQFQKTSRQIPNKSNKLEKERYITFYKPQKTRYEIRTWNTLPNSRFFYRSSNDTTNSDTYRNILWAS